MQPDQKTKNWLPAKIRRLSLFVFYYYSPSRTKFGFYRQHLLRVIFDTNLDFATSCSCIFLLLLRLFIYFFGSFFILFQRKIPIRIELIKHILFLQNLFMECYTKCKNKFNLEMIYILIYISLYSLLVFRICL